MVEKRETRQKKAMEEIISKTNTFFTAEDLHNKIKKDHPALGIATIYRFLNEMQKERAIHVFNCQRRKLYSKKEMNHSHFVCEMCGSKKHIQIDKFDFLKKFLKEDLCHVQVEISGICVNCKKGS